MELLSVLWVVLSVPYLAFTVLRLKYQLHMLQLNSYRNERYSLWLKTKGHRQYRELLGLLAAGALLIGGTVANYVGLFLWAVIYLIFIQARDKTPPKKLWSLRCARGAFLPLPY